MSYSSKNPTLLTSIGISLCLITSILLTACGGGGGGGGNSAPPPSNIEPAKAVIAELLDPSPGENNAFGLHVLILSNGNIVVASPGDSSQAVNGGAVHLYDGISNALISSLYGSSANQELGSSGLSELSGSRYIISSSREDSPNGLGNAGSVRVMNGSTGQTLAAIYGDHENDLLGSGGITVLPNGNFLLTSPSDDVKLPLSTISNGGSVRMYDGSNYEVILPIVMGDQANDSIGNNGIKVLANGNFIVSSTFDDVIITGTTYENAGSVTLVNGDTSETITAITGNDDNDSFGSQSTVLDNDNFLVISPFDTVDGDANRGSVQLVDGMTGALIGSPITGEFEGDQRGSGGALPLPNSNFVLSSPKTFVFGAGLNAGYVSLHSGISGQFLGILATGESAEDRMGENVTLLPNGNIAIGSSYIDAGGVADVGAVQIVDSTTTAAINSPIFGSIKTDYNALGVGGVFALSNNNIAVNSYLDGAEDTGTVQLIDGTTGNLISILEGDDPGDGRDGGFRRNEVYPLNNGNYILASPADDVDDRLNAGSVTLINGSNGNIIGTPITGDEDDFLAYSDNFGGSSIAPGVVALGNNHALVISVWDDGGDIDAAGSVLVMDGDSGSILVPPIYGKATHDFEDARVFTSAHKPAAAIALFRADKGPHVDSGRVILYTP